MCLQLQQQQRNAKAPCQLADVAVRARTATSHATQGWESTEESKAAMCQALLRCVQRPLPLDHAAEHDICLILPQVLELDKSWFRHE